MGWNGDPTAVHRLHPDEFGDADQKVTPVDADIILLEDSEDGFAKKWAALSEIGGGGSGANAAYSETIGDGTNTTYAVIHDLGTTDLVVQLWDLTGTDPVEATGDASSIDAVSTTTVEITFGTAPAADSYRVVILADGGSGGGSGGLAFIFGSYTGNGAASQTVNLSTAVELLFVHGESTGGDSIQAFVARGHEGMRLRAGSNSRQINLAVDGESFIVIGTANESFNQNGAEFTYIGIHS